jgi:hypothetical protein
VRPSCQDCARKHLGQASALLGEVQQGYPDHLWLAIGHMAEAADELVQSWPDMANEIRAHRKRLELDKSYQVPVVELIGKVGRLEAPLRQVERPRVESPRIPHEHTVSEPPVALAVPASGCTSCDLKRFAMEQAPRYQAEQQEIGSGKPFSGRLVIIATLGSFDRSYSLTSVIIDQAKAAVLAGLRVDLWVNRGCDMALAPVFPHGVTVVGVMPPIKHVEDVPDEGDAQLVLAALNPLLDLLAAHGPVRIIAHDLLLQSWFVTEALALHHLQPRAQIDWWHLIHSSVNNRLERSEDPASAHWLRSHLPAGHRLLAVNASDVQQLAHYYHTSVDRIQVLPNSRDPLQVLDLTPDACAIATAANLVNTTIVQVLPVSADRLLHKGALELVRLFGALEAAGTSVRLVFVVCNCADDRALQQVALVRRAMPDAHLSAESVVFTHEVLPATAGRGLSQASIRGLFALSNLFAFPTVSEAASLVVWEAMLAGCLLVLNDNLPCMKEQLPRTMGLWVPWPSHKQPGAPSLDQSQLEILVERIEENLGQGGYVAKKHALWRCNLITYANRLAQVLGLPSEG